MRPEPETVDMSAVAQCYDFLVAGGGTAGLLVASRLSENPNHSVLVLEAGQDLSNDPRVTTPAFYTQLLGSEADWAFATVPQEDLNGRVVIVNQGKALGGSSSINAHVLVPPAKSLIDSWEALGNPDWNWDALSSYYNKAFGSAVVDESQKEELGIDGWTPNPDPPSGPISVSFQGNLTHPIRKAWAETFRARGQYMADNPYFNATIGSFSNLVTTDSVKAERSYVTSAYYNPIKSRPNLRVLTGATVKKILFAKTGGKHRAVGVEYTLDGKDAVISAKREVILAAGAVQSPKLLELSGIGNAELLEKLGIPVVKDLPGVGENLQDHIVSGISYEVQDHVSSLDALMRGEPDALAEAIEAYQTSRTGPLTSIGLNNYAYLPVINHTSPEGRERLLQILEENRPPVTSGVANARDRVYYDVAESTLLDPKKPSAAFFAVTAQAVLPVEEGSGSPTGPVQGKWLTLAAMLSSPLSRGTVHISSDDINAPPTINPRYLSNKVDLEVFGQHLHYIEDIAASPELKGLLKQPLVRRDPNSHLTDVDEAKRYVQRSSFSNWHVGGTCSLLPEDKGGVVGTDLKVHGITNLRVVDSSAIPLVSTANLQATVYAFAERAADLIKASHK